eukprot:Phypoly_transcript_20876.p1 GENE.Phypoly_transcript_20876~~Phypoly_transcript_20876.p1  ORF type:complete len:195 (+),score=47.74 Phypoly_transcript_20876:58-642(+)
MAGRFLSRAKQMWRRAFNLYERPSPYDDAPPKSQEMRYPSPANQPPPVPFEPDRRAHQYLFEREQRGTWSEEPPATPPPAAIPSSHPTPGTPHLPTATSTSTGALQATGEARPLATVQTNPFAGLKPLDFNKDPKANLHEYWRKINEFYGMDMRNMRNWERYPEKIFTEEGKGRIESFPKIDTLRVSHPPWYGY